MRAGHTSEHSSAKSRSIPFTGIPIAHFLAMLRKDYILWRRDRWKTASEIFVPVLLFVIVVII